MSRWYVVYTQPKSEAKAVWHLRNQNFVCLFPRVLETRNHARQAETVLVPLFPRYLFVQLDLTLSRWRCINGTRGVVKLLANGLDPIAVPDGIIEALITKCDKRGVTSLATLDLFSKGRKVRIKTGPFEGQLGEVTRNLTTVDAYGYHRVGVLLTLLGAQSELQLPSYAIEAA